MQIVIETLESRIAPAAVFTYTEGDGDKVTIKTTAKISNADFEAFMGSIENTVFADGDLTSLYLEDPIFRDTSLTVTVKKAGDGNGQASIGNIYSPFDLKNVVIKGDLEAIQVGDANYATLGLGKLTVNKLGSSEDSSYFAGAGSIKILGDLVGGMSTAEDTNIGSVKISGNVEANGYVGANRINSLMIGGDVRGRISVGTLDSVRVAGSLIGGSTES